MKIRKIITGIFICFLLTGCGSNTSKPAYHEISYQIYQEKMQKEESFLLYIGSTTCTYCQKFAPTLNKIIRDYKLDVLYINLSKLEDEQLTMLWDEGSLEGTPTILFVEKGKIKLFPRIEGAKSEEYVVEKLKSAGYIK